MTHPPRRRPPLEPPSWALSWDSDRADDRRALKTGIAFALVVHAALLTVRIVEEKVELPPVDVVIRPRLADLAPPRPKPPPEAPETAPAQPAADARPLPVPAELAPPEPLPAPAMTAPPVALTPPPVSVLALPEAPPTPPGEPVRFRPEMERPVRVAGVDPAYTEAARKVRKQGVVILDAVIDESGAVTDVKVLKELGFGLTEAAVRAVATWRVEPARLDGEPVAVRYNLTVRFTLR
ncbi:MAG: energy transducer TonB [Thermoanaerobaculia bacterium]|nr:energy transducer TonB [Thermoanaerobaculia bacterium]